MNNVECKEDFLSLYHEMFPHHGLTERDDILIGMAINHAYLCMRTSRCKCGKPLETDNERFTNQCSECAKKGTDKERNAITHDHI